MKIALQELEKLLEVLEKGDVTEFEYAKDGKDGFSVRIQRGVVQSVTAVAPPPVAVSAPAAAPVASSADAAGKEEPEAGVAFITSPFVGTFYAAPSPGADNFVKAGDAIKPGQTLCIIEAMKLMNEIEAESAGTVVEALVENGQSVEYGQRLFKVRA